MTRAIEAIAEQLGIDLTAYGNASPTRLILETLKTSVQIIQQTTQIAITEQNPLTATELRSRIGLATLSGLNPAKLLTGAVGKVRVNPNGHVITIAQHAKLRSVDNVDYYVVLPSETVRFNDMTELQVRQGTLKSASYTSTGEKWESFRLQADNYVDVNSIEAFKDNVRLKVGFALDEQADVYVRPNYDGDIEVVIPTILEAGENIQIDYADCLGIDGNLMTVEQVLEAKDFAYEGSIDVSDDIIVYVSQPIIGGIDFAEFDTELAEATMLSGRNNLIGTEAQLVAYLNRFKQYTIQSAKVVDGVFTVTALRNLAMLCKTYNYWDACKNLTMRAADILSLSNHMNQYSNKSIDLLVSVKGAIQESCRVNVAVNMDNASHEAVLSVVTDYLLSKVSTGNYDIATLYRQLLQLNGVKECSVTFDGNVNSFGTAIPTTPDAILICTAANITVNGVKVSYGEYKTREDDYIDTTVDNVTTERITTSQFD